MRITATVKDCTITAEIEGTAVSCKGMDWFSYSLDEEWAEKANKGVWFACGSDFREFLPLEGMQGEVLLPQLCPGTLRLTFDGWNDVDETHLITKRMQRGLRILRPGNTGWK